jgi:L-iditol 2-dehydrogenase
MGSAAVEMNLEMNAAFLLAPGALELRRTQSPRPAEGEVLVRVEAALTCGTDVKTFLRGHARLPVPAPFGHECAGTVAAVGDGVSGFREGDAVMYAPTAPCGECRHCAAGRENLCGDAVGRMVLGAFAEFVLLPAHIVAMHLFHRPPQLTAAHAAVLEPLACVVHGASRIGWSATPNVAIIGDGPIALLFARVAVLQGARVLLLGRRDARLDVARQYGASAALARDDAEARDAVGAMETGGADVVIECAGTPAAWRLASELAAPGGTVMLFGGCAPGTEVSFDAARIHYEEVNHVGAFHYTPRAVRAAFSLLESGDVDAAPLITHRMPLVRLHDALELVMRREAIKVEVVP